MRVFLLGIVAAVFAFAQSTEIGQAPPGATLAGRVITVNGTETRPVRRARVTLTGGGLTAPRAADTDTKGAYRFDRLPAAGPFKIAVQKPGFVRLDADAAPNADLKMERAGAIEGIVMDAGGDPLMNVVVRALQPQSDGTPPKPVAQARTDDLGRYRLHSLASGDYYVETATDPVVIGTHVYMPGEKRPDVNRGYYPAAMALQDARTVRVSAPRDATAIDLTFAPALPVIDPAAPPPPPRPDATGTARIAGQLVDAVSGKPVKNARLLLVPLEGVALTNWKRSDRQGRFEYTQLTARRYRLSVDVDRYISLEYGQRRPGEAGTPIEVRDGQDFKADMALPRASAIEGTLLDEFGDPAPGVLVQIARKQFVAGRHRLMPQPGRAAAPTTDDRGYYRASGLAPGDYFVAGLSGAYADANEVGGFAPTYYPGSPESGAAVPVTVPFAADAQAAFALTPAKTFMVAGTMVDAEGKPISGRGTLWLMTPDRLHRADFNLARGVTTPDGRFVLRNVPQGSYTMQGFGVPPPGGRGPGNLAAMPFGWLPVTVGDTDLDGVVLKVTNGTVVRGRITLDDSSVPPPAAREIHVTTYPVEFDSSPVGGGPSPSETYDDLTFEVAKQSGLRRIIVGVASPNWTVKKITLNDMDVTDSAVDLRTRDVEGVEVLLTPKVSVISGIVPNDKGEPLADYAVVVFASDPTKWIDRSRFVVTARPSQQGRYVIRGLPPEEYLAVALPNLVASESSDPDFLQQLRPIATTFVLTEGEKKTLDLKLKKRP
jgi:protocatechuate 3,4-dioxygenase beta subunit